MQSLNLNDCEKNVNYQVVEINSRQTALARRLTELGFVEGARVNIIQFSSLKKTILLELEGYVLSLRASVAEIVKVRK